MRGHAKDPQFLAVFEIDRLEFGVLWHQAHDPEGAYASTRSPWKRSILPIMGKLGILGISLEPGTHHERVWIPSHSENRIFGR